MISNGSSSGGPQASANANSIFIEDGFSNEDSSRGSANTLAPAAAVIRTKFTKCIIFLEISNYHAIDTEGYYYHYCSNVKRLLAPFLNGFAFLMWMTP